MSTKRKAPVDEEMVAECDSTWRCNRCEMEKSRDQFAQWALRTNNHICRVCATKRSSQAHKLRNNSLDRTLMGRLRRSLHKAGWSRSETFKLKLSTMQALVAQQGARSIISGIEGRERLTVARWDCSRPWSFENLVIVSLAESRAHNARCLESYHPKYVHHVEQNLLLLEDGPVPAPQGVSVRPHYPPTSQHKRGITTEVASWYLEHFQVMYPTMAVNAASRVDLVPRGTVAVGAC